MFLYCVNCIILGNWNPLKRVISGNYYSSKLTNVASMEKVGMNCKKSVNDVHICMCSYMTLLSIYILAGSIIQPYGRIC